MLTQAAMHTFTTPQLFPSIIWPAQMLYQNLLSSFWQNVLASSPQQSPKVCMQPRFQISFAESRLLGFGGRGCRKINLDGNAVSSLLVMFHGEGSFILCSRLETARSTDRMRSRLLLASCRSMTSRRRILWQDLSKWRVSRDKLKVIWSWHPVTQTCYWVPLGGAMVCTKENIVHLRN